jgi:lipopolysaccharide biosynthesis glycosyltransferase
VGAVPSIPFTLPPLPPPRRAAVIHVLLATDAQQVIGCAVSMRSILEHARPGAPLHFHLMTHRVPARDVDALRRTVTSGGGRFSAYEVDVAPFLHLMRSKIVSHVTYARLLLERVLPAEVGKCVYVDCDMVVTRDIAEAWEFPLDGRTVAAVANGNRLDTLGNQQRLGLAEPRYFNAGFVVIDVHAWRERTVAARAIAQAKSVGDRLVLHDQDALNLALQGDWAELPREWNAGLSISDWLTADSRAVFHYWGAPKPWHADYQKGFQELFLHYLDKTAYAGYRPWNPLGLGAALRRLRRKLPYLPAVVRAVRARLLGSRER